MAFNVETIIEIPKGSNVKYEIEKGKLFVDRILFGDFVYPANYGFIPHTLDWDGDPLDVLIIGNYNLTPGVHCEVKIVGAMKMIDDGETDTKLVGVMADDPNLANVNDISDIDPNELEACKTFFLHYKDYKNAKVEVPGFENADYAEKELAETKGLFKNHSSLDKKVFIEKMKAEHPEKYTV